MKTLVAFLVTLVLIAISISGFAQPSINSSLKKDVAVEKMLKTSEMKMIEANKKLLQSTAGDESKIECIGVLHTTQPNSLYFSGNLKARGESGEYYITTSLHLDGLSIRTLDLMMKENVYLVQIPSTKEAQYFGGKTTEIGATLTFGKNIEEAQSFNGSVQVNAIPGMELKVGNNTNGDYTPLDIPIDSGSVLVSSLKTDEYVDVEFSSDLKLNSAIITFHGDVDSVVVADTTYKMNLVQGAIFGLNWVSFSAIYGETEQKNVISVRIYGKNIEDIGSWGPLGGMTAIAIHESGYMFRRPMVFREVVASSVETKNTVKNFSLEQNYPNPFNPATSIHYTLAQASNVDIRVYDVTGKEVAVALSTQRQEAGVYSFTFSGSNLASGTYFYRLRAGGSIETKKMVLVK